MRCNFLALKYECLPLPLLEVSRLSGAADCVSDLPCPSLLGCCFAAGIGAKLRVDCPGSSASASLQHKAVAVSCYSAGQEAQRHLCSSEAHFHCDYNLAVQRCFGSIAHRIFLSTPNSSVSERLSL